MIPRGLTTYIAVSAVLALFPSADRANDRDVFREAYPQCFRLFPEGSAERATCLVVLPWNRAWHYNDDELTALVQRHTEPTPRGGEFRDLFPRCFALFAEGSWDRQVCLDVSASHGYARYTEDELKAAVHQERARRDLLLRHAEQRRQKD